MSGGRSTFARVRCSKSWVPITLYLCFVLLTPSATAEPDPYWQKAGALIQAQDYAAAYAELQLQLQTRPDDVLLLRLTGVTLIETSNLDAAVSVLARATEIDPENVASWYYLGQALAYRGNLVEAIRVLQYVISIAPESEYANLSQQVLPELEQLSSTTDAISDQRRWNLYVDIGAENDNNVPARSDEDRRDTTTDSWRLTSSLYVEYRPLDQMADTNRPVTLGLGYSYYGTWYDREIFDSYDVASNQASVYLSRNGVWGQKPYTFRMEGGYTDTQLGGESYSEIYNAALRLELQWLDNGVGNLYYTYRNKDFDDDTESPRLYSRDGEENVFGITQYFYFLNNRLSVGLGYAYREENTNGSQFELESNDIKVSFSSSLPWRLRLRGYFLYQDEDYVEYTPKPKRLDDVRTYHIALSRPVLKDIMRLELYYTYTASQSTLGFSEYNRTVAGTALSISW